jgi:hypothetical protein
VVYGLVHQEQLADVVVEFTLGQTGFDRYNKLLAGLFEKLAGIDIANVRRQSYRPKPDLFRVGFSQSESAPQGEDACRKSPVTA